MPGTQDTPEILLARERRAVPWRNGGGVTREIAASPAGASLSDFDWRVSTAEVASAGPFSLFPGVDRSLAVLQGELSLSLDAAAAVRLSAQSPPFTFGGDVPAHGEPLSATVTDLNVMTRRGRFAARVARARVADACSLALGAPVTLLFACADLSLEVCGDRFRLTRWDAARFSASARCVLDASSAAAAFYLIEITPAVRGAPSS